MKIVIFGSTGATGREAVGRALDKGHHVLALDAHSHESDIESDRLTHGVVDVLNDDLAPHLDGADAVLSCLGVGNDPQTLLDPPPLYTDGTRRIVEAMKDVGCRRLIVISASFVETTDRGPIWFRVPAKVGLHKVFEQMAEMEAMLRATRAIDWTAVRPGWLLDAPYTGDYHISANVIPEDLIRTRHADLAAFMVDLAENGEWIRDTPAIAREESPDKSSPAAVIEDMIA